MQAESKQLRAREVVVHSVRTALDPLTLVLYMVFVGLCVLSGPFGTFWTMTVAQRLAFWPLALALSFAAAYAMRGLAIYLCGPDRPTTFAVVKVVLATLVVAPMVYGLRAVMDLEPPAARPSLVQTFIYVVAIMASVTLTRRFVPGIRNPFHEMGIGLPPPRARLADRLSDPEAQILRLTVEDHCVDVVTSSGTERLRMRFADAVAEMVPVEGFPTHRSHWVAAGSIQGAERDAGRWVLRLANGDVVPVSRGCLPALVEAGIIRDEPVEA
ncbi:LytTR family DNA-binding domain-containing protein [Mesobacterium pallidum]|uniref:LytTR family DNA-binding domain-containing protein n=1 Tax=Mesobacterium pallidum TaxID=2872037 RepID=UPI001EE264A5|nr:LytTR family DNA-binding domain-containing protein [Mesobacterium pallidum]